jgi:IclR family KDG regulon transcriptional repressor
MLNVPPGTVRPLYKSGMGWALLSVCDDAEILTIIGRFNAPDREKQIDADEFMGIIEEVRAIGYARSRSIITSACRHLSGARRNGL